jgi:hypothetical protein
MTVAAIAAADLPDSVVRRAGLLLREHPAFAVWQRTYRRSIGGDFDRYLMMRAATWPDDIRRDTANQENHPYWHFIDYPLRAPRFPFERSPLPEDDLLRGIVVVRGTLTDFSQSRRDRAVALSWMIHLIADAHQPLHCGSLYNGIFAEGDRGGNLAFIKAHGQVMSLHHFWDGLLGSQENVVAARRLARSIIAEQPQPEHVDEETTAESWTRESREIAIRDVYRSGDLSVAPVPADAPSLPVGYEAKARHIARIRVLLAGRRLADELKRSLGRGPGPG